MNGNQLPTSSAPGKSVLIWVIIGIAAIAALLVVWYYYYAPDYQMPSTTGQAEQAEEEQDLSNLASEIEAVDLGNPDAELENIEKELGQ